MRMYMKPWLKATCFLVIAICIVYIHLYNKYYSSKTQIIDQSYETKFNIKYFKYNEIHDNFNTILKFKFDNASDRYSFERIQTFLYDNKAFICDIDLLNKIKQYETISLSQISITSSSNDVINCKPLRLTFGLFSNKTFDINNFKKNFNNLNTQCGINESIGKYIDELIYTNIYIKCNTFIIQLAIFYSRNTFLWIGHDFYNIDQAKWFGDRPRAMSSFKIRTIGNDSNLFWIPSRLSKFDYDYSHSTFVECNRDLKNFNEKRFGDSYRQNEEKNKKMFPSMVYLSSVLESYNKHYWLSGGTLLGWYRDCGIIPHTNDIDFAIWHHEYDQIIEKTFLGHETLPLITVFGMVNNSYELRLTDASSTQIDMFLVYKVNETKQWCAYHERFYRQKRWLSVYELCSTELFNHKFLVPCQTVDYLNKEYGSMTNWMTPKEANYTWFNMENIGTSWTESEWPHAIKFYKTDGTLDVKKTLAFINENPVGTTKHDKLPY